MPAWGGMGALTDEELNQVGAYLETLAMRGANWKDKDDTSMNEGAPAREPSAFLRTALKQLWSVVAVREAKAATESEMHLGHILVALPETPDGVGLATILEEEAAIAQQHAGFAASDLEDLENIQLHTHHVRHAMDPSKEDGGPGKGYGVCRSAAGIAQHMALARDAADASDAVKEHAADVIAAAHNISLWCGKILDKAAQILGGASPVASAFFAEETVEHIDWILHGRDADGDGATASGDGEGGLDQIKQSLAFAR
jgi:hypothetical protein